MAQEYHQDWSLVQELTPILAKVEQFAQNLLDSHSPSTGHEGQLS